MRIGGRWDARPAAAAVRRRALRVTAALRPRGGLDLDAAGAALANVVGRHKNLRTLFVAGDGVPQQVGAAEPADVGSEVVDAGLGDDGAAEAGLSDAGAVDDGAVDDGAAEDGAAETGAVDAGAADADLSDDGVVDDGAAEDGAVDDGAVDDGAAEAGLSDAAAADDGAVDDGAADTGLAGAGRGFRETMLASLTFARPAATAMRERAGRVTRTPAFCVAAIAPLVIAGGVGASAPTFDGRTPLAHGPVPPVHAAVTPVAAISPAVPNLDGPVVIAMERGPVAFHVAAGAVSAPPPPMIVNSPGALGIPSVALAAYRNAEQKMSAAAPGCGVSWNLLAGIGRIESGHAGGGAVDARGTAVNPIYGPALDGTLPGNEVIVQSTAGNRVTFARAMGPMQFLPGTWARYAVDGDGDGIADPQNLFDSTLAAARYLCSGGFNLRDPAQVMAAILRYNNSMAYAQNVLGWAAAYATGVVPVDLPPMTGPPPPLGNSHDEHPEGLGPGLPMNVVGLPANDPMRMPLIDLGQGSGVSQPTNPWAPQPAQMPGCTIICIGP